MALDKFGRSGSTSKGPVGPPGIGFKLSVNGEYDMNGKRLINLKNPSLDMDAVTKKYVDDQIFSELKAISETLNYLSHDNSKMRKIILINENSIANLKQKLEDIANLNQKLEDLTKQIRDHKSEHKFEVDSILIEASTGKRMKNDEVHK